MSIDHSTCSHCGKSLKRQTCYACEGKGYAHKLAFMKKECVICHGSGWVWRCEDEFKHIVEDFKAARQGEVNVSSRPLKHRHAVNADDSPEWDPSPWRPMHPENPWNLTSLNDQTNKDALYNPSHKHRLNRNAVKK